MKAIRDHIQQIKKLCDEHSVRSLFAFGSVTTDRFKPDSDIDLVVDIASDDPIEYSDHYFALKFQLEQILQREIDLLEQKAIRNPFLKQEIDQTKILVYGK
ncbi:putative nucleotidyltransferase [Pontibacter aydingkolensis]|uniref:Nucleotidyltransferase domain-containing protein n=1 Tax=Pontibacter aydingkolensis TaxID=1911536 RepID=A0ABS7CUQ5_9BACT|nr:nucleotidyltransferase domain-containing protein [Pontibacter aydingkolensis]MBW7467591.1 nucleotidyltransferase domain-containing protein [Pontibacter aydingkolensis]